MLFLKFGTFLLLVSLGVVSAVAQVHSASEPIEISGQIRFASNNTPAPNIVVRIEALSGGLVTEEVTDRLGKFRFSSLSPVQYFVTVRLPGYREVRREVNLIMQSSDFVQIQLVPEISGTETPPTNTKVLDANVPPEARSEFEKGETALLEKTNSLKAYNILRRPLPFIQTLRKPKLRWALPAWMQRSGTKLN